MIDLTWMAWTWQTAAFFIGIGLLLASMTAWEIVSPGGAPRHGILTLRLRGDDLAATLAFLRRTWERFEPHYPFAYRFVDEAFAQYYEAEQRMLRVLGVFAGLAVFIACLGLFGLAAFTAMLRTKEIGVRKVLGATAGGIVLLLSKDFARLVAAGFVVAAPVAYVVMHRWLDAFAYRVDLSWGLFAAAGLFTLVLALATVSYQALRAALTDPVKALRHE